MSDLRGYTYSSISHRRISKDKFELSKELESQVTRDELKNEMSEAFLNNGKVYFISRKKEVCGVVIIRYEKHFANEFLLEEEQSKTPDTGSDIIEGAIKLEDKLQDKLGTKKSKAKYEEEKQIANAYVLDKLYLTEELKEKDKVIMFDMIDMLKEAAAMNDLRVKVIIWGENIIVDKTLGKTGGSESSAISIGICLGICVGAILGTAYGNVGIGMCFGIAIGSAIGAGYYGTAKVKKSEEKESTQETTQEKMNND